MKISSLQNYSLKRPPIPFYSYFYIIVCSNKELYILHDLYVIGFLMGLLRLFSLHFTDIQRSQDHFNNTADLKQQTWSLMLIPSENSWQISHGCLKSHQWCSTKAPEVCCSQAAHTNMRYPWAEGFVLRVLSLNETEIKLIPDTFLEDCLWVVANHVTTW